MKEEYIIEIIKNEWADIHHTRNQEWTSLAIIGGVFWALFSTTDDLLQKDTWRLNLETRKNN